MELIITAPKAIATTIASGRMIITDIRVSGRLFFMDFNRLNYVL